MCVCVRESVFMSELLTEVTLGLFLHSGDGTVLVCEEKLLELGHLVLQHGHFILRCRKKHTDYKTLSFKGCKIKKGGSFVITHRTTTGISL